jgi:transcriptional regulator with XRE-family HTH domain
MFIVAGKLLRQARESAGLTQAELAERLDVPQSSVARLESSRANPRLATLERALAATGKQLKVDLEPATWPGIDESLIESSLDRTPAERLAHFVGAYRSVREFAPTVRSA